jgi:type IV secretion system protein VirB10
MVKNQFEGSPDIVEIKGKVVGVTRLSKKAKMLIMMSAMVLLGFIIFSIYTIDDADKMVERQENETSQAGPEPAKPGDMFSGISDGQASYGLAADSPIDPNSPNAISSGVRLPAPAIPQVPAPNVQPPMTPEQQAAAQLRQQREQVRLQARGADLEASGNFVGNGGMVAPVLPSGFLQTGMGTQPGQTGMPMSGIPQDDPNKQIRKELFLKEAGNQSNKDYLGEVKQSPIGKYEIKAGWLIPAVLESGINSDLPGQVCARVRENVYDTRTGKYLLIPQGTKACGVYDSQVAMGQTRILLVWNRLIFEDGSSISLQGMPGADQAGYAGFDGDVDNHYMRIFGNAILMTIISAGAQLSQPQQSANTNTAPSSGQTMAGALGQQLGQVGTAMTQRNMQIQPTIKQAPGYRFNIMVTRDVVFPGAYSVAGG